MIAPQELLSGFLPEYPGDYLALDIGFGDVVYSDGWTSHPGNRPFLRPVETSRQKPLLINNVYTRKRMAEHFPLFRLFPYGSHTDDRHNL